MVIWLVAAGLMVLGGLGFGLEYVRHRMQNVPFSVWHIGLDVLAILAGVFFFLAADSLAEQLTDDID
jgi:hypothetical protein